MANYIGPTGLNYLWGKVKSLVSGKANTADLATVATSGSYTDLDDLPVIPAAQVNSDWNASSGVAQILNKPTIPTAPSNIVTGTSSSYTIWVGTQAQYEAISTKDATTIYLITGS